MSSENNDKGKGDDMELKHLLSLLEQVREAEIGPFQPVSIPGQDAYVPSYVSASTESLKVTHGELERNSRRDQ